MKLYRIQARYKEIYIDKTLEAENDKAALETFSNGGTSDLQLTLSDLACSFLGAWTGRGFRARYARAHTCNARQWIPSTM